MSEDTQAQRDAEIEAAFRAYDEGRTVPGEDGKPRRPKPHAEILLLWEAMWQACDFSWAGLADAGWERGDRANFAQKVKRWRAPADFPGDGRVHGEGETAWKEASLQDYWRWSLGIVDGPPRLLSDAQLKSVGLLVRREGGLWHVLHDPGVRVSVALDVTEGDDDLRRVSPAEGPEGAGGAGAVLGRLLLARLAAAGGLQGSGAPDGRVPLAGARAAGLDTAWRAHCAASEDARLQVACPLARFDALNASGLRFGDGADFTVAALGDKASFSFATLGNGANFSATTLGDRADFWRATLGDGASFSEATLGDRARFFQATLGEGARFSDATLGDGADFLFANLGDGADFFFANLGDGASFAGATFGDGARFARATLGDGASFARATLGDGASFTDATLKGQATWNRAVFSGTADFSYVKWNRGTHYGGAFDSARFEDLANFKTGYFHAFAALSDATFKQRLLLQPASGGDTPESIFRQAKAACEAAIRADLSPPTRKSDEGEEDFQKRLDRWTRPDEDDVRERRWGELSAGYRTAKAAMEAQGDFEREQTFYRFEVKARVRKPSVGWFERRAAGLYALLSNYRESIWRPFAGLGVFFSGVWRRLLESGTPVRRHR